MIKKFIIKILKLLFPKMFENDNNNDNANKYTAEYKPKNIMTKVEKQFYDKLIEIEKLGDFKVHPQINLASIVQKISNSRYQSELYRNIDYAIFDKNYENLLLLVELNDESHNKINRKDRDLKVKKICNDANIKLLTFYTKYPNEKDYILNRVLNEIKKEDN